MTPGTIRGSIVGERVAWVRRMLGGLRELPLGSSERTADIERLCDALTAWLKRNPERMDPDI